LDGFTAQDIIVLELFCGTAGVTACFKRCGFANAVAVDKTRHTGSLAGIISLDLTKIEDQRLVLQWLDHPAVRAVFLAPPCGTASAARMIELVGEDAPRPLQSFEEPDGLSSLHGTDLLRVSAANILYAFTAEIVEKCCANNVLCMVENPRSSLFWFVTPWVELTVAHLLYYQDHQACMYGSKRPKFTRLCANFEQVCTISALCDGRHEHEPWGIVRQGAKRTFATALEVHYPKPLCEAIVKAFMLKFVELGMKLEGITGPLHHAAKALAGQQAISMKLPPLIPTYKHRYVVFLLNHLVQWPVLANLPGEHKLLHTAVLGEVVGVELRASFKKRILEELCVWMVDFSWESFEAFTGEFNEFRVFGVPCEPEEFLHRSLKVAHPMDRSSALPVELRFAVLQMSKRSPADIARHRLDFFKFWNGRAKQLEVEELEMRKSMDNVVAAAVQTKKLALFKEMLEFYQYPDMGVLDELVEGAELIGEVPRTGMLPLKFSPALLTEAALETHSILRRPLVEADGRSSGDLEVDREVWEQTLQECAKGWLAGPLTSDQVPEGAPISKRFGLRQKHKIRLIDDFSESCVNQAVTVFESPTLHTVDVACAAVACWFGDCVDAGMASDLQVKTFDLASAYRQVGLNANGRRVAYIRVWNPSTSSWAYFQAQVLPFGAVRSVHSFLRLARAIWWLGTTACLLVWSSFFDDYIVFSTPTLSKSTELTASSLFSLLGWDYAKEGRKCVPFSASCEALGVNFDLSQSSKGLCFVSNTQSRVEELVTELDRTIAAGKILQSEAQRLRGRMQFADSQLYGRTGKRCSKALREAACRRSTKLKDCDLLALQLFSTLLSTGKPRTVLWGQLW